MGSSNIKVLRKHVDEIDPCCHSSNQIMEMFLLITFSFFSFFVFVSWNVLADIQEIEEEKNGIEKRNV